jgi:hypothetical protein
MDALRLKRLCEPLEKAARYRHDLDQDAYCHGCLNAATCNVILKDDGSILEPCGDRIEDQDDPNTQEYGDEGAL